jgi:hypothetical protein
VDTMEIIAQVIGGVALLMAIISFQNNTKKGILIFQLLAGCLFAVHFLFLGAYTGAALNVVSVIRNIVYYQKQKHTWARHKGWLFLFMAVSIAAGILTWEDIFSLFPILGMVLGSLGFWLDNPTYVRRVTFPVSPLWITYNIVKGSYAGIITEIFVMSSIIVGMIRFDRQKKENAEAKVLN